MKDLAKLVVAVACLTVCCAHELNARAEEAASPASGKPAASPQEIAAWVADLDSGRYLAREEATQHLLAAGTLALDPLLAVANSERPEPADRAIWILRRQGRSRDNDLSLAALERLVQLEGRPVLVAKAESELAERSVLICEQRLGPLGADVGLQLEQIDESTIAPVLSVRLDEKWHGTTEDLRAVSQVRQQQNFRLQGAAVVDDVVKMFEAKEKLAVLQLIDTKVTPAAIDALKARRPDATLYVRNQAKLGVGAENHAAGVRVTKVETGSAADSAGIVPGDIISTIDGHPLPDFDRLTVRIAQHQPGDRVDVEIIRDDKRTKLTVTLGGWAPQGQ